MCQADQEDAVTEVRSMRGLDESVKNRTLEQIRKAQDDERLAAILRTARKMARRNSTAVAAAAS